MHFSAFPQASCKSYCALITNAADTHWGVSSICNNQAAQGTSEKGENSLASFGKNYVDFIKWYHHC